MLSLVTHTYIRGQSGCGVGCQTKWLWCGITWDVPDTIQPKPPRPCVYVTFRQLTSNERHEGEHEQGLHHRGTLGGRARNKNNKNKFIANGIQTQLGCCDPARSGGGALPVIMSIIGPRETHDYRNYNLLVRGTNTSPPKTPKTQYRAQYRAQNCLKDVRPLDLGV